MNTGCQGPYCHGTGGFCGCNCKCCPPPCCPVISVYFQCCPPPSSGLTSQPAPATSWDNLPVDIPIAKELPDFTSKPIFSEDKRFILGLGSNPPSCPCETTCVELQCGTNLPCCCLELLGGIIYSVGNGYVTAPSTIEVPNCGMANVFINGLSPPVFVNDCEEINVSLVVTDMSCCPTQCVQIEALCSPCPLMMTAKTPLWRRKIDARTGKTKINPTTGKPIILLNKAELIKRVLSRKKKSRGG